MTPLATIDSKVVGEFGKVFSTDPYTALGEDGKTYFVKGRNSPTAFKEIVGCSLAAMCGLKVPRATVCGLAGDLYAGVEAVPNYLRSVQSLLGSNRIANNDDLYRAIAVDAWLVNHDRNMGNVVASALGNGLVSVFMIDFEKSVTLGPSPFTSIAEVEPSSLWPNAELGTYLKANCPARCPGDILQAIRSVATEAIQAIVNPVAAELPFVDWQESTVEILMRRAAKIDEIVEGVWQTART